MSIAVHSRGGTQETLSAPATLAASGAKETVWSSTRKHTKPSVRDASRPPTFKDILSCIELAQPLAKCRGRAYDVA